MKLITLGMLLFNDIFIAYVAFAIPLSANNGHTTHNGHISKNGHTTHRSKDTSTTSRYEGTTMMEPIEYELHKDKIIPDLSSLDKAPEHAVKIVYEEDVPVCFGNTLRAAVTQNVPESIFWYIEDPKIKFHTIIFVDLDVPSRDNSVEREWQHWIIVNIPDNRTQEGQTLTEYIGPTSMHGNGTHRYVFQLFLQKQGKINFKETHLPARNKDFKRAQFSSKEFANKYGLGRPYAVNYFFVTWPEEPESEEDDGTPMPPPPMPEYSEHDSDEAHSR